MEERRRPLWHPFRKPGLCGLRGTMCVLLIITLVFVVPYMWGEAQKIKKNINNMWSLFGKWKGLIISLFTRLLVVPYVRSPMIKAIDKSVTTTFVHPTKNDLGECFPLVPVPEPFPYPEWMPTYEEE